MLIDIRSQKMKRVPEGRSTKILKQSENDICIQTIHNHMHIIHLCNCCTGVLRVHSSRATGSIGKGTVVQTRSSEYSKRKVGVYLGVPELLLMSLYIVLNFITRLATIREPHWSLQRKVVFDVRTPCSMFITSNASACIGVQGTGKDVQQQHQSKYTA